MKLSDFLIDCSLKSYLEDGDPAPLQRYLDENPEMMQDDRIKSFLYGLMIGEIKRPKKRPKVQLKELKRDRVMCLVFYFMGQGLSASHACDQAGKAKKIGLDGNTIARDYQRPHFKKFGENPVKISERQAYFDGFMERREVKENPELIRQAFKSIWGFELSTEEFDLLKIKMGDK